MAIRQLAFYTREQKISLDKNLVINIKDSPLNLSFNNVVSLEFRDIRTLVRHFSSSRIGPDYTHVTIDSSMVTNNLKKDTLVDLIDANFAIPFILTRVINNPNGGSEFSISIDTDAKLIKHFSFSSYSYFSSFEKQTESKYSYGFENLPYTIVENNGKTKIVAEVFGKEVEKYYPLLKFYSYNRDGNNTQYINENMSITKKDTTTGREINYFPATNSSYIKITIGN